jgi:hypothetical protein
MTSGMLWFNQNADFEKGIRAAAAYYEKKYGRKPTLCLVNPSGLTVDSGSLTVDGITVKAAKYVLPKHLWIGVEEGK